MIHEENTTEIEIPGLKKKPKVLRFPDSRKETKSPNILTRAHTAVTPWLREFDLESPWIVRMLAVLGILILSMLIL